MTRSPLQAAGEFAEQHRPLLQEIGRHFVANGSWPSRQALGREALRRGDQRDVFAVLREIPVPLGQVDHDDTVRLRVRGLVVEQTARPILDGFVSALMLATERLIGPDEEPSLGSQDLLEALGMDEKLARRVGALLLEDGWMLGGGSGDLDDGWKRDITEHTRFVAGVKCLEDYLQVESQQRWPSPATPLVLEHFAAPSWSSTPVPDAAARRSVSFSLQDLHPIIADAAREPWAREDWPGALHAAWFALRDLVRRRLDLPELDGTQLMERIGDSEPRLALTDMTTASQRDMHRGVWRFLVGIAFFVRNPDMHDSASPVSDDPTGAYERLAVMSIAARHVESAASPSAVDEAVAEASQPSFAATTAAVEDLIRTVPTARRVEFVDAILSAAEEALAAKQVDRAEHLCIVMRQLVSAAPADDPVVSKAAARCGRLVAADETLTAGIRLLAPATLRALAPRHRDKAILALVNDVRRGPFHREKAEGAWLVQVLPFLYGALPGATRSQLTGALQVNLAAGGPLSAYAERVLSGIVPHLDVEEASALIPAFAAAVAREHSGLGMLIGMSRDEMPDDFRHALIVELRAREEDGPTEGKASAARLAERLSEPIEGT